MAAISSPAAWCSISIMRIGLATAPNGAAGHGAARALRRNQRVDVGEEHLLFLRHVLRHVLRRPSSNCSAIVDHLGVPLAVHVGHLARVRAERLDRLPHVGVVVADDVAGQEVEVPGVEARARPGSAGAERRLELGRARRGASTPVSRQASATGPVAAAAEVDAVTLEDGRGAEVVGDDVANGGRVVRAWLGVLLSLVEFTSGVGPRARHGLAAVPEDLAVGDLAARPAAPSP